MKELVILQLMFGYPASLVIFTGKSVWLYVLLFIQAVDNIPKV